MTARSVPAAVERNYWTVTMKGRKLTMPHHLRPKLTDAERYRRFLDAAKTVGASDDPEEFDRAFGVSLRPSVANRSAKGSVRCAVRVGDPFAHVSRP